MKRVSTLLLAITMSDQALSQTESELWDLSLAELMNVQITRVATGSPAPLNRAAAVA